MILGRIAPFPVSERRVARRFLRHCAHAFAPLSAKRDALRIQYRLRAPALKKDPSMMFLRRLTRLDHAPPDRINPQTGD